MIEYFLYKISNKARMCSPLPFNSILEIPANAVRENKRKVIWIEKEDIKLSLFIDDTITYVENLKKKSAKKKKKNSWN